MGEKQKSDVIQECVPKSYVAIVFYGPEMSMNGSRVKRLKCSSTGQICAIKTAIVNGLDSGINNITIRGVCPNSGRNIVADIYFHDE